MYAGSTGVLMLCADHKAGSALRQSVQLDLLSLSLQLASHGQKTASTGTTLLTARSESHTRHHGSSVCVSYFHCIVCKLCCCPHGCSLVQSFIVKLEVQTLVLCTERRLSYQCPLSTQVYRGVESATWRSAAQAGVIS